MKNILLEVIMFKVIFFVNHWFLCFGVCDLGVWWGCSKPAW